MSRNAAVDMTLSTPDMDIAGTPAIDVFRIRRGDCSGAVASFVRIETGKKRI